MKRIRLWLPLVLLFSVAVVVSRVVMTSGDSSEAGQPTALPFVPAPGAERITPDPTSTPLVPPSDATPVASQEEAEEIALRRALTLRPAGDATEPEVVSVVAGTAGEYDGGTLRFRELSQDYPLWVVTLKGHFERPRGPAGAPRSIHTEMILYVDPVTGISIGMSLRGGGIVTATP